MPLAEIEFGHVLLVVLEVFLLVAWFWVLVTVIGDLFRDHEMSGWGKALWIFFLIVLPVLGTFIYLVARGGGMRERMAADQADAKAQFERYIRDTAASSSADELQKLSDLRQRGDLSDAEFERAKAKLLS